MKKIFAFGAVLLLFASCGVSFNTEAKIDEVLDIHDEVMPKIGEVMNLKKKVLEKAEIETDSIKVNELRDLAKQLDDANTGMMVWMREWSANSTPHVTEESSLEERKAFFKEEIEKVSKVRDDINNSIDAAKKELQ
jgi:hypothetical protein